MKSSIAILSAMMLLGGCSTTNYVQHDVLIDQNLETQALTYEIRKADKFWVEDQLNISAGPYSVSGVDQGWLLTNSTEKFDWTFLFDAVDNKEFTHEQRVRFNFTADSGKQWRVRCEKRGSGNFTQVNFDDYGHITNRNDLELAYVCDFKNEQETWQLVVEDSKRFGAKAFFQTPEGNHLDVEPFYQSVAHPIDNSRAGMHGYYLVAQGQNVAAVSTLPLGQMWVQQDKALNMQDNLAMASIGLWFYHNGFDKVEIDEYT